MALKGSLDHQVPVESLAGLVANLKAGGNKHVESAILPSLNHLFIDHLFQRQAQRAAPVSG